ncbi:hypothetical protein [Amycolatopsis sp. NPDC059020]|uniref:hypothetical protein n=1 Tax=Amycolatopsis sp. NPDC059020 TaxID=3346703 RepID=UPI00366F2F77
MVSVRLPARRDPSRTALVIGADKHSTIMDRSRRTVSLFGAAASAVVLGTVPRRLRRSCHAPGRR